jgi:HemY protein
MRLLFWLVALFAAAAALAVAARLDQGYVQFAYAQWRVEMSLLLFGVAALLAFAALHVLVRLLQQAAALPATVRAFRDRRRRERAQAALADALQAWFEGRYTRAEKEAALAWESGAAPGLAAIIAARAAHELGAPERRAQWLERADAAGQQGASLLSRAVIALSERDYRTARESLRSLQGSGARHIATLRLLMRAERGMRNWQEVLRLAGQLGKRDAIPPALAEDYRNQAHVELLKQAAAERTSFEERWGRIPERERTTPRVAAAAARHARSLGLTDLGREAIEKGLAADWDATLVSLYSELPEMPQAARIAEARARLERAERWLLDHAQDPQLLATLGRLCVQAELWGKAQSYLEASLAFEETRASHLALAQLLERLGRGADAQRHYKRAAEL